MSELINRHIATLLRRHDCVIVPGVGAFIAISSSAQVTADNMFAPPTRLISFNQMISHDDGLLADSISRRLKISFEQARERVKAESQLMLRRLKAEGCVHLLYVGTLSRHIGGRLEFEPERPWMLPLPLLSIQDSVQPPVVEIVADEDAGSRGVAVVRIPLQFRRLRAAAAAIIVLVFGFMLSTPIDMEDAHTASLSPLAYTPTRAVEFEEPAHPVGLELNIAMPGSGSMVDAPMDRALPKAKSYIMVVASLASMSQAEKFIADHRGHELNVAQCGDKYRVYAASGDTQEEAMQEARNIRGFAADYPDAWLCRR